MEPVKQIKVMKEFQKQSTQLDMTVLTLTLCWLVYFTSKFKAGSLMSYNSCSVYLFAIRMDELEHCKSIVKHIQFYVMGFWSCILTDMSQHVCKLVIPDVKQLAVHKLAEPLSILKTFPSCHLQYWNLQVC